MKISRVITLMIALLACDVATAAQNLPNYPPMRGTPDCILTPTDGGFTAVGTSAVFDNRGMGCTTWHLVYNNTGYSALNIAPQSADDSGGIPGSFSNWGTSGGTLASGTTLPLTAITSGQATGYKYRPFVRVNLSSATGSGRVTWMLYGYRPGIADSNSASGFVSPTTTSGTASANAQPGYPIMCDTATSGTVTAGQSQMVRCGTDGKLALVQSCCGDSFGAAPAGMVASNGATLELVALPAMYNTTAGVTTNYPRVATLNTMIPAITTTARNTIGAQITEAGSRWSVIHNPAAGSQATASIAAEASVRHVVDKVCFAAGSIAAPVATSLQVNIRDGATGAGNIIAVFEIAIPASAGNNQPAFCTPNLNLVGTTNTAMTAEWSAGLANLKESVTITGFNVN
jgi:hypothetical protein